MLELAAETDVVASRQLDLTIDPPAHLRDIAPDVAAPYVGLDHDPALAAVRIVDAEADAGIAYASDGAGGNGPRLTVIPLPPALEQRAEYVAAVTARTKDAPAAGRFVEFLVSEEARAILMKRGLTAPDTGSP